MLSFHKNVPRNLSQPRDLFRGSAVYFVVISLKPASPSKTALDQTWHLIHQTAKILKAIFGLLKHQTANLSLPKDFKNWHLSSETSFKWIWVIQKLTQNDLARPKLTFKAVEPCLMRCQNLATAILRKATARKPSKRPPSVNQRLEPKSPFQGRNWPSKPWKLHSWGVKPWQQRSSASS